MPLNGRAVQQEEQPQSHPTYEPNQHQGEQQQQQKQVKQLSQEEREYWQHRLPHGFQFYLERLARGVIRNQPPNIVEFAAVYLEELLVNRNAELWKLPNIPYFVKLFRKRVGYAPWQPKRHPLTYTRREFFPLYPQPFPDIVVVEYLPTASPSLVMVSESLCNNSLFDHRCYTNQGIEEGLHSIENHDEQSNEMLTAHNCSLHIVNGQVKKEYPTSSEVEKCTSSPTGTFSTSCGLSNTCFDTAEDIQTSFVMDTMEYSRNTSHADSKLGIQTVPLVQETRFFLPNKRITPSSESSVLEHHSSRNEKSKAKKNKSVDSVLEVSQKKSQAKSESSANLIRCEGKAFEHHSKEESIELANTAGNKTTEQDQGHISSTQVESIQVAEKLEMIKDFNLSQANIIDQWKHSDEKLINTSDCFDIVSNSLYPSVITALNPCHSPKLDSAGTLKSSSGQIPCRPTSSECEALLERAAENGVGDIYVTTFNQVKDSMHQTKYFQSGLSRDSGIVEELQTYSDQVQDEGLWPGGIKKSGETDHIQIRSGVRHVSLDSGCFDDETDVTTNFSNRLVIEDSLGDKTPTRHLREENINTVFPMDKIRLQERSHILKELASELSFLEYPATNIEFQSLIKVKDKPGDPQSVKVGLTPDTASFISEDHVSSGQCCTGNQRKTMAPTSTEPDDGALSDLSEYVEMQSEEIDCDLDKEETILETEYPEEIENKYRVHLRDDKTDVYKAMYNFYSDCTADWKQRRLRKSKNEQKCNVYQYNTKTNSAIKSDVLTTDTAHAMDLASNQDHLNCLEKKEDRGVGALDCVQPDNSHPSRISQEASLDQAQTDMGCKEVTEDHALAVGLQVEKTMSDPVVKLCPPCTVTSPAYGHCRSPDLLGSSGSDKMVANSLERSNLSSDERIAADVVEKVTHGPLELNSISLKTQTNTTISVPSKCKSYETSCEEDDTFEPISDIGNEERSPKGHRAWSMQKKQDFTQLAVHEQSESSNVFMLESEQASTECAASEQEVTHTEHEVTHTCVQVESHESSKKSECSILSVSTTVEDKGQTGEHSPMADTYERPEVTDSASQLKSATSSPNTYEGIGSECQEFISPSVAEVESDATEKTSSDNDLYETSKKSKDGALSDDQSHVSQSRTCSLHHVSQSMTCSSQAKSEMANIGLAEHECVQPSAQMNDRLSSSEEEQQHCRHFKGKGKFRAERAISLANKYISELDKVASSLEKILNEEKLYSNEASLSVQTKNQSDSTVSLECVDKKLSVIDQSGKKSEEDQTLIPSKSILDQIANHVLDVCEVGDERKYTLGKIAVKINSVKYATLDRKFEAAENTIGEGEGMEVSAIGKELLLPEENTNQQSPCMKYEREAIEQVGDVCARGNARSKAAAQRKGHDQNNGNNIEAQSSHLKLREGGSIRWHMNWSGADYYKMEASQRAGGDCENTNNNGNVTGVQSQVSLERSSSESCLDKPGGKVFAIPHDATEHSHFHLMDNNVLNRPQGGLVHELQSEGRQKVKGFESAPFGKVLQVHPTLNPHRPTAVKLCTQRAANLYDDNFNGSCSYPSSDSSMMNKGRSHAEHNSSGARETLGAGLKMTKKGSTDAELDNSPTKVMLDSVSLNVTKKGGGETKLASSRSKETPDSVLKKGDDETQRDSCRSRETPESILNLTKKGDGEIKLANSLRRLSPYSYRVVNLDNRQVMLKYPMQQLQTIKNTLLKLGQVKNEACQSPPAEAVPPHSAEVPPPCVAQETKKKASPICVLNQKKKSYVKKLSRSAANLAKRKESPAGKEHPIDPVSLTAASEKVPGSKAATETKATNEDFFLLGDGDWLFDARKKERTFKSKKKEAAALTKKQPELVRLKYPRRGDFPMRVRAIVKANASESEYIPEITRRLTVESPQENVLVHTTYVRPNPYQPDLRGNFEVTSQKRRLYLGEKEDFINTEGTRRLICETECFTSKDPTTQSLVIENGTLRITSTKVDTPGQDSEKGGVMSLLKAEEHEPDEGAKMAAIVSRITKDRSTSWYNNNYVRMVGNYIMIGGGRNMNSFKEIVGNQEKPANNASHMNRNQSFNAVTASHLEGKSTLSRYAPNDLNNSNSSCTGLINNNDNTNIIGWEKYRFQRSLQTMPQETSTLILSRSPVLLKESSCLYPSQLEAAYKSSRSQDAVANRKVYWEWICESVASTMASDSVEDQVDLLCNMNNNSMREMDMEDMEESTLVDIDQIQTENSRAGRSEFKSRVGPGPCAAPECYRTGQRGDFQGQVNTADINLTDEAQTGTSLITLNLGIPKRHPKDIESKHDKKFVSFPLCENPREPNYVTPERNNLGTQAESVEICPTEEVQTPYPKDVIGHLHKDPDGNTLCDCPKSPRARKRYFDSEVQVTVDDICPSTNAQTGVCTSNQYEMYPSKPSGDGTVTGHVKRFDTTTCEYSCGRSESIARLEGQTQVRATDINPSSDTQTGGSLMCTVPFPPPKPEVTDDFSEGLDMTWGDLSIYEMGPDNRSVSSYVKQFDFEAARDEDGRIMYPKNYRAALQHEEGSKKRVGYMSTPFPPPFGVKDEKNRDNITYTSLCPSGIGDDYKKLPAAEIRDHETGQMSAYIRKESITITTFEPETDFSPEHGFWPTGGGSGRKKKKKKLRKVLMEEEEEEEEEEEVEDDGGKAREAGAHTPYKRLRRPNDGPSTGTQTTDSSKTTVRRPSFY